MLMDESLQMRIESVSQLAQSICISLNQELLKLGFAEDGIEIASYTDAEYRLERDPASGRNSLVGVWRNAEGFKCGELLFHADGSFFAEYDVVRVHPQKPRWFVEAVTAWGRGSTLKSEPRLLPVVA
jgi:hypothetical protein